MRNSWVFGFLLLAACSVAEPPTPIANKLRECGLIGEGNLAAGVGTADDPCTIQCLLNASCSEASAALCRDPNWTPLDDEPPVSDYDRCFARCFGKELVTCDGGRVNTAFRCDGWTDCADGSDEEECPVHLWFVCDSGARVARDSTCNGLEDCADGSDEAHCEPSAIFRCDSGEQIHKLFVCDSRPHCKDGSDEKHCPADGFFVCDDGRRVLKDWVCNLEQDCEDGSDEEQGCAELQCGE